MTDRLLLAWALVVAITAAIAIARRLVAANDRRVLARLQTAASATDPPGGTGARILYFTTETCVVCKRQQAPAFDVLRQRLPALRIEEHDAVRDSALASEFHVRSVPTTAVYDAAGDLVAINRGFAPASMLLAQLEGRTPDLDGGVEMAAEAVAETPLP